MKVLQTIAGFGVLYGGIATCTYDLISAMHDIGFPLDLLTLEVKNSADKLMGKGEDWIKALPNDAVTPYEYSKRIAQYLKSHDYDLYHTNGLWMYCNHVTCSVARHRRKPYIITPHGMLLSRCAPSLILEKMAVDTALLPQRHWLRRLYARHMQSRDGTCAQLRLPKPHRHHS